MFNNPYNMFPYQNPMMASNMMGLSNVGRLAGINGANAINTVGKVAKPGLFKSLAGIKWGSVLTNTQKTLNVINQAIPVYYQMKPIWGNLKSFGKIMSIFNEPDNNSNENNNQINNNLNENQINKNKNEKKEENTNLPTFFIN